MPLVEPTSPTGRDLFAAIYDKDLESEAAWLRLGAMDKADSVVLLLKRNGLEPKSILELGGGTGEVISELQRRGCGETYTCIDYSDKAIAYLRSHSHGIDARVGDITAKDFAIDGQFDLVVLSHVLEHLEDPAGFLRALLHRIKFKHLIAEVPLEDLLIARLKSFVKDRTKNLAGHIQFFTGSSFLKMITGAGLKVLDRRRYANPQSRADARFMCNKNGWGTGKYLQVLITNRYLPLITGPLWRGIYMSNLALLCERQVTLPLDASGAAAE
jgi:2-polyprenyl-3-methyl-5-hydroxy-6-metoxy-1,4-benzoquinol methylase